MIALLPWGAHEQHGPLLPANTDTTIAEHVANRIADKLDDCIVLDSIPYGVSIEHNGYSDTISLSYSAAIDMIKSILINATQNSPDIELFVIINGHGGNQDVASMVCRELNYTTTGARFEVFHVFPTESRKLAKDLFGEFSAHADSVETSVWSSITNKFKDQESSIEEYDCKKSLPHAMKLYPVRDITNGGIVSKVDDLIINKDKGKQIIDCSINAISEKITEYLDTIHAFKQN